MQRAQPREGGKRDQHLIAHAAHVDQDLVGAFFDELAAERANHVERLSRSAPRVSTRGENRQRHGSALIARTYQMRILLPLRQFGCAAYRKRCLRENAQVPFAKNFYCEFAFFTRSRLANRV